MTTTIPLRLAADRFGPTDGVPLVVLHGLFGSARNWTSLAKAMAQRLDRPVLVADLRNHGASPWDDRMDYPAMAADVSALIARETAGGPVDLLGHSMGGKVGCVLALTTPGSLRRLLVLDIAPVPYRRSLVHHVEAMRSVPVATLTRKGEADGYLKASEPDAGVRAFLAQNLVRAEGDGFRWRVNLAAIDAHMADIMGFPPLDGRFGQPTMFLCGGTSDYVRTAHRPEIDRLFPAARIETVEGAGHWVHAEQPQAFLDRAVAHFAG